MSVKRLLRPFLRLVGHQDYIKFSLRKRWISRIDDPETAEDEPFQVPFGGYRYSGNFKSTLDWEVYYFGAYAKEEMHLLRDILRSFDNPVMFDVGGNCGHHSLYTSQFAKTVHTFEPYPPLAKMIREKIAMNSVKNVVVHELGLSDAECILPYHPPDSNHIGLGSFVNGSGTDCVELKVVRADDLFSGDTPDKLNLVKIDVEGFEVNALRGMQRLLHKHRPVVFLEWSEPTREALGNAEFLSLFPEKYHCYEFIDNSWRPRMRVFRQPGYGLVPVSGTPPLANLLIAPEEFIERCRTSNRIPDLWTRKGV